MKFATKPIWHYPPHLTHVATLPGKIKNSNFCRYLQIWKKTQIHCILSTPILISLDACNCVCWVHVCVFIKILFSLLYTMLIVDKHCNDVCCDEFWVPQIDRKSKQVKEQWHGKFYLQPVWRTIRCFKHRKYQNLWLNNKVRGDKYAILFAFSSTSAEYRQKIWIFNCQGSVATYLRWGG